MGTGKTVTAAFLVDELVRRRNFRMPRPILCFHFCRDDETGRILHIISVLILSLLHQLPGLKKSFHRWYKNNQESGHVEPAQDHRKLMLFMKDALQSLDRPAFLIIDGLDECDDISRIAVLDLCKHLMRPNRSVKFLLLSRRNEDVLARFGDEARIYLISDAMRDRAIVTRTVDLQLTHLSAELKDVIIDRLSHIADGSAIWTKMVVQLLHDRRIRALGPLQRILADVPLPSQLSQLYDRLLLRSISDDEENSELASAALVILTGTSRPLSVIELAWAATLATTPAFGSTVALLSGYVDSQRVLSLVLPFVSISDAEGVYEQRVQVVHQSVKEYVLQRFQSGTFELRMPTMTSGGKPQLEFFMLQLCIKYLLLDEIAEVELFSIEQKAVDELPQQMDLFGDDVGAASYTEDCTWDEWEQTMTRYDPMERGFGGFFVYASCCWTDHFSAISDVDLPLLKAVETLCAAGSLRLQNWTQQFCRPRCAVQARFEFDSTQYDPLAISSLYGSDVVLRQMLQQSDFSSDCFFTNTAIAATSKILLSGRLDRLGTLMLSPRVKVNCLDFWWRVLKRWQTENKSDREWDTVFPLIDHMTSQILDESCANEILCVAAAAGCLPVVQRLMLGAQRNQELHGQLLAACRRESRFAWLSTRSHQSVGEAVRANHRGVLKLLLQQDGIAEHLNYINSHGDTVLHLAAIHCDFTVYRSLLTFCSSMTQHANDRGNSALVEVVLSSAPSNNRVKAARLLLLAEQSIHGKCLPDERRSPLRLAVQKGDIAMCSLLLSLTIEDPSIALQVDDAGVSSLRDQTEENTSARSVILQLLTTSASKLSPSTIHTW